MRNRRLYGLIGLLLLSGLLIVALWPEALAPYSPYYRFGMRTLYSDGQPAGFASPPFAPSADHPLGTDSLGRDLLSMLVWGARHSLLLGLAIVACRFALALPAALFGYYGGHTAHGLLRRLYLWTTTVPPLILYIALLGTPELLNLTNRQALILNLIVLTVLEWPRLALNLHGWLDRLGQMPFVEGAVAAGLSRWQILRRHLLPHLVVPTTALVSAEMGRVLLLAGQLGLFSVFLAGGMMIIDGGGFRPQVLLVNRIPEWGAMLAEARHNIFVARWNLVFPALTLFVAIFSFHLVSEGVADLYDTWGARLRAWLDRIPPWRRRVAGGLAGVVGFLAYFQGLPWGDGPAIQNLLHTQAQALRAGDRDGFLAVLAPSSLAVTRVELANWFEAVTAAAPTDVQLEIKEVNVSGPRAVVVYNYSLHFADGPRVRTSHEFQLVKRWGRWAIVGEPYERHDTRWARLITPFPLNDASIERQGVVNYLAVLLDQEGYRLAVELPGFIQERLTVKIYPTHQLLGGAAQPLNQTYDLHDYYVLGESLRADAQMVLSRLNDQIDTRSIITQALLGHGVYQLTGGQPAPLLYTGLQELYSKLNRQMVILPSVLDEAGPLRSLAELAAEGEIDAGYRFQAGLLVQWLFEEHDGSAIVAALATIGEGASELAAIATATGLSEAEVIQAYDAYVVKIVGES